LRTEKRKLGDLGENASCMFLVKHGYEILERNYLKPWGEIDIIAKKGNILHFIEVKSVNSGFEESSAGYRPEENVHEAKRRRISRTLQTYLIEKHTYLQPDWQFDVILVYISFGARKVKVKMLPNIVL
jgi:putative endonuclease